VRMGRVVGMWRGEHVTEVEVALRDVCGQGVEVWEDFCQLRVRGGLRDGCGRRGGREGYAVEIPCLVDTESELRESKQSKIK